MPKKIKQLRGFKGHTKQLRKNPSMFFPTQTTTWFPLVFSIHAMHKLYISEEIIYNANHSQVKFHTEDITFAARYEHNQSNLQDYNFAFFCKNLRCFPKKNLNKCRQSCLGVDQHHLPFRHADIASASEAEKTGPNL